MTERPQWQALAQLISGGVTQPTGEAPATFQEERFYRIWSATRQAGGRGKPAGPDGYLFDGPLDVPALEDALNAFLCRHRSVWARFAEQAGEVVKVLEAPTRVKLSAVDLRQVAADAQMDALMAHLAEHQYDCDDLAQTVPHFCALLFVLGEQRHALATVSSLSMFDDRSWDIFWPELSADYARRLRGEPLDTAPAKTQYADYAAAQRSWHGSSWKDEAAADWRRRLEGAEPFTSKMPTDLPREAVQRARDENFFAPFPQKSAFVKVSADTVARLKVQLPRASTRALCFAAFCEALGRKAGAADLVVRTLTDSRERVKGHEGVVGFFQNFTLLRLNTGARSFRQLAEAATAELEEVLHLPEFQLVPCVFPRFTELFRVLFNYYADGPEPQPPALPNVAVESLPFGDYRPLFNPTTSWQDWTGGVFEMGDGGLGLRVLCNGALWSEQTAAEVGQAFVRVLEQGAAHPDGALGA